MTPRASLAERLAAFSAAVIPVWVYDHDRLCFVWANPEALILWRAESLDEFRARDLSKSSESTLTRLSNYLRRLRSGEHVSEDWTLYPRGVPTTLTLHGSLVELDDGRQAILFQALAKQRELDASLVRGVEALRHTSLLVSVVGEDGQVVFQNPAALRVLGDGKDARAWFVDESVVTTMLAVLPDGQPLQTEAQVRTTEGTRWHVLEARPTVDPVTGVRALLVQQRDVSDRRRAEDHAASQERLVDELKGALALVESQRREILTLSAPLIPLGPETLALPLIGALDPERTRDIAERLLDAVVAARARFVVLDLTGVDAADDSGAASLRRLVQALRLLGAQPVLTGIRPQLAQALVHGGIDLLSERVLRTLYDGLLYCEQTSESRRRRLRDQPLGAVINQHK